MRRSHLKKINLERLRETRAVSGRRADGSAEARTTWSGLQLDGILVSARARGLVSDVELDRMKPFLGREEVLSWRDCARKNAHLAEGLYRLAAVHSGYRAVNVCRSATLTYNARLAEFLSDSDWSAMFGHGILPVIEYGNYPDVVRRHLLASGDPTSNELNRVVRSLPMAETERVFVPHSALLRLRTLLEANIPALKGKPFGTRPVAGLFELQRIDTRSRRKAA